MGRDDGRERSAPVGLLVGVVPPALAAVVGVLGSRDAPAVYARLAKPDWAPPSALFGPVWTGLYASLGFVGWRMWHRRAAPAGWVLHGVQLTLNAAWSPVFFGSRDKRTSLAIIAALDLAVAAQAATLARHDRVAAAALAPYLAWLGFATALNAAVSEPPAGR